ncbi:uncharacterized protein LOC112186250 isoform X2 [Rosa chinensis]|uniref:uncharacterized protein LOC112186250 isoform X2 n=1 Tax=Rosa chinensis TaxID=74649 RepID=UPI000D08A717|nr:uncharacterized protein LOC112186250 isoform X2 [Rosa chinensis]
MTSIVSPSSPKMALLGDDGRGYELACKLESCNVWRTWLGDSNYATFVHVLSSPSTWDSFMRSDDSKSRAQIQLQLRARALLFDKACVSLFLRLDSDSNNSSSSSSSSLAVSKLNPTYLQLHADDVYFTLENSSTEGVQAQQREASKIQSKTAFGFGSRYGESEIDNKPPRFKNEELPETWYNQVIERHRASKPHRLSSADRESEKRTPEEMSAYLKLAVKHKKRCLAFKEDQYVAYGNPLQENASQNPHSVLDGSSSIDHEASFFPETMFTLNCVPDSALPPMNRVQDDQKVEFYGVLDTLPQALTRSPVMLERLGIRPEYLNMDQGGSLHRGKNGSAGNKSCLTHEQAAQLSQKVIARMLTNVGFEGSSEVPIEVFSQLLSCHIRKLGSSLKVLTDSYRKQCSAIELLKMFLQTVGYRNFHQQSQQQIHGMQSQLQPQHQNPIRLPQQISRQMHPQMQQIQQMQQIAQSKNVPFQQQQQMERMRRRQPSTRAGMDMVQDRPMVQVKIEAPSELPMDSNAFNSFNNRHPQLQFRQQQIPAMSNPTMQNVPAQSGNQFRQISPSQIAQIQSQNAGVLRARPVKVEGFQELMGGDASSKHDSDENRLTSPK